MFKLQFKNSLNQEIELFSSPFHLSKVEGLGEVGAELQTVRAPYQDGETLIDTLMESRYITIELTIRGKEASETEVYRRYFASVFNPRLGLGELKYVRGNEEKVIKVVAEAVPSFPDGPSNRGRQFQKTLLFLRAPDPYWKTATDSVEQLVTFSGGLTFPLRLPTIFGNQDSKAKSRIIVNEGDAPTPIEITFEGPATSPIRIDNETTGEFIEVAQNLLEGEQLWISTAFGRKRVEKILVDGTRINAFHHIYVDPTGANPSSTFFQLQPGNNLMTYNTGVEYEKAPVTIRFQPRYLAI